MTETITSVVVVIAAFGLSAVAYVAGMRRARAIAAVQAASILDARGALTELPDEWSRSSLGTFSDDPEVERMMESMDRDIAAKYRATWRQRLNQRWWRLLRWFRRKDIEISSLEAQLESMRASMKILLDERASMLDDISQARAAVRAAATQHKWRDVGKIAEIQGPASDATSNSTVVIKGVKR